MSTRRGFLAAAACAAAAPARKRPNIVVLLTDDQRHDTVGALGHPIVRTPNMDRLVRGGVAFSNAYIMGGTVSAICVASRAMMLSGRGLFEADRAIIRRSGNPGPEVPLFPELLGRHGYRTFITGK